MHRRVYSSHFHTTSESEDDWKKEWKNFKTAHGEVDTADQGHSRRADLFISLGTAGLVSVEFKYVPAGGVPSVDSTLRQMTQHLSKHQASISVLYAAEPVANAVAAVASAIRAELHA